MDEECLMANMQIPKSKLLLANGTAMPSHDD
jgi:hypothetical protein